MPTCLISKILYCYRSHFFTIYYRSASKLIISQISPHIFIRNIQKINEVKNIKLVICRQDVSDNTYILMKSHVLRYDSSLEISSHLRLLSRNNCFRIWLFVYFYSIILFCILTINYYRLINYLLLITITIIVAFSCAHKMHSYLVIILLFTEFVFIQIFYFFYFQR